MSENQQPQTKAEVLKEKVVAMVKEFTEKEGGVSWNDLETILGHYDENSVLSALKFQELRFKP